MKKFAVLLMLLVSTTCWGQEWAEQRLGSSPRHSEWVNIKNGDRTVKAFVAYPERSDKAPVVLVIHEIFGLTDWARLLTDELAEAGYIAVAPDLLSGSAPDGGGTASLGGNDAARNAIAKLDPEQITGDITAALDYATQLPASNGKVSVAGFCWGGTQSFRFATNSDAIEQAFVFYGTAPTDRAELERISAPVYGFYAENDARVNATLENTEKQMAQVGKTFRPVIYSGGGHGFMRAGDMPDASPGNKSAMFQAWKRWLILLESLNG